MTCGRSLHNIIELICNRFGSLLINATVTIGCGRNNTKMATVISLLMLETIFGLSNDRYFVNLCSVCTLYRNLERERIHCSIGLMCPLQCKIHPLFDLGNNS